MNNPVSHQSLVAKHQSDLYLGDELDVLEVVAKLEKKYGKEILTKEQREKLKIMGRLRADEPVKAFKEEAFMKAYAVIKQLERMVVEKLKLTEVGKNWHKMEKSERRVLGEEWFGKMFGGTPKELGYILFKSFVGV